MQNPVSLDKTRLNQLFLDLASIDTPSFGERQAADAVTAFLTALDHTVEEDDAGRKLNGNCGNLLCRIPGTAGQKPLLFSTHLDMVAPCLCKNLHLDSDGVFRSDGTTILGADDYAGVTAVLEAVRIMKEHHLPHRPLELLFSVAEEAHLKGIRAFDTALLTAKEGYVLDTSGSPGIGIIAAPGHHHLDFLITGRAAHAGIAPETGVSAIYAAAQGVSKMKLGRIDPETTANIGEITGGGATNIVAQSCHVTAECRSLDGDKLVELSRSMIEAMQSAADQAGAELQTTTHISYLPYQVDPNEPVVTRFLRACQTAGISPKLTSTGGGSDLNVLAQTGIRGMVLSCGMQRVHSTQEFLIADDLHQLTRLVIALILADQDEDSSRSL